MTVSDIASRTPRVTIHSLAGCSSSRSASRPTSIGHFRRQIGRAVDIGAGDRLGYINDMACVVDVRSGVADLGEPLGESARSIAVPENGDGASTMRRAVPGLPARSTVASRSRAPSSADLRTAAVAESASANRSSRMSRHIAPSRVLATMSTTSRSSLAARRCTSTEPRTSLTGDPMRMPPTAAGNISRGLELSASRARCTAASSSATVDASGNSTSARSPVGTEDEETTDHANGGPSTPQARCSSAANSDVVIGARAHRRSHRCGRARRPALRFGRWHAGSTVALRHRPPNSMTR